MNFPRPRFITIVSMALTCMLLVNVAKAQNLPPELLRRLKAATVFIHAETHSDMPQGSGCFIEANLIVTTARTLRLNSGGLEPKIITVVVNSGQPDEKELPAELVAYNTTSNMAFLRIAPSAGYTSKDFLLFGSSADLRETQSVYLAGYPLGTSLSDAKNPAITVAPATLSSFRRNAAGTVELLQLDGNLIPGNSGGPLVDMKGKVIGIAESMVMATQIGFAIPSDNVKLDLEGRLGELKLTNVYRQGNIYTFDLEARVCDPKRTMKQVAVQYWIGKAGTVRPKDPKQQFPIHGALGDGPKKLVKLKADADDATGKVWKAEVTALEFPGSSEFWVQAGYMSKSSKFVTTASVNQTAVLFAARQGVKPAPVPKPKEPAQAVAGDTKHGNGSLGMSSRNPPELIPPVTPYPEDSVRRQVVEHEGAPWLVSPIVKYPLADISQIVSSPSGDAVYVVFKDSDEVHKYDPKDYSQPVEKVKVGEGANSIWCDSQRVVVGCTRAGKVVFLGPDLKLNLSREVPNLVPHSIVGRAPDGSVISVWRDKDKPNEPFPVREIVLVDEKRKSSFVGRGNVEHCCFCFDGDKLLMQQFIGSPGGAPELFDIGTNSRKSISDLTSIPIKMHNEFMHVFPTFDNKHLVMPHSSIAGSMLGPMETSLVSPNLRSIERTFAGGVFAEDPVNQWLIALKPELNTKHEMIPAVLFINRQTGKSVRNVLCMNADLHPSIFMVARSKPRCIYVPGHEQVLIIEDKQLLVANCSLFEKEAPVDVSDAFGSTVTEAVANAVRMKDQQRDMDRKAQALEEKEKKRKQENESQILGSQFGAKLAARFRGAKPIPPVAVTATVLEGKPLTARREQDKSGKPVTRADSTLEKFVLGTGQLLQVLPDPTGEKLYAIYDQRAAVAVFDTQTFAEIGEIAVPQFPVSMGCHGASLVVACDKSAVIAFIDRATATVTKSVKVKETESQPKFVCDCAPDGSSVTIWSDDSIFLVHPDKPPMFVLRSRSHWCAFPGTARHVWLQGNFTNYPSGSLSLVDTTQSQPMHHMEVGHNNKNLFGRKDFSMHRDCGRSFLSYDGTRFFAPVTLHDYAQFNTEFPVRTLVIRSDLSEVITELPGAVIHESEANDAYISWHSLGLERHSGFEVLYISRATGRIYRRIKVASVPMDLRPCPGSAPLSYMLYVPGRELILAMDPSSKRPELWVARCGPIAEEANTMADTSVKSKTPPPQLVIVGKPKKFNPEFTFPTKVNGPIKYRIKQGIPGVTIDAATGEITLDPKASHLGKYEIQVEAEADGQTVPVLSWVLEVDIP